MKARASIGQAIHEAMATCFLHRFCTVCVSVISITTVPRALRPVLMRTSFNDINLADPIVSNGVPTDPHYIEPMRAHS